MGDGNSDVGRFGHTGIDNVVVACHTWYADMVASLPASAAEVTASWQSRFRPTAWPLTRLPTVAERRASPGGFVSSQKRDERGRFGQVQWWRIAPPVGLPEAPKDSETAAREMRRLRRLRPQTWRLASDAGGLYLAIGERRVRDSFIEKCRVRDSFMAARALDPVDRTEVEISRFIEAVMPRSRGRSPNHSGRSSRKCREPAWTARALALALLVPRLGVRPAARELLRWDHDLEAPDRNVRGGELAHRDADHSLQDMEADALDAAEAAVLRSADRVWEALGIDPRRQPQASVGASRRRRGHTPIATATSGHVRSASPSSRRR